MPKILVVEDERVVAWDVQEALEKTGYQVVATVASAAAALAAVREHQPDLVLMDIRLAGKQDGVTAAENIYQRFGTPIIFLTAHADQETLTRATAASPFGYLVKPFQAEQIHTAIQVALQRYRLEQETKTAKDQVTDTLRSLGEATIAIDLAGRITFMNPVAETLTGWQQADAIGQSVDQVLSLLDGETLASVDYSLVGALEQNALVKLPENCLLLDKNGIARYIGDTATPITNQAGEVTGSVMVFQDISDRKRVEDELSRNAFYDGLTGLPNRSLFLDRLNQSLKFYKQRGIGVFAVVYLDLDEFKEINASLGHLLGDRLLVEVGQRFTSSLRSCDTIARLGSNQFAVLLQNIRDLSEAELCTQRLQAQLIESFVLDEQTIQVTASIGIALGQRGYKRSEEVLRDADAMMYQAKQAGGNCYRTVAT
ncbi:MAG: diguanylate cyclase [Aphanocapsa sp. GSE-SYN-MK-11-07L]|jgi:diguanylate cyclase (GGDEF)-like protein/PAS domain S-box-containing protein|nr:diguanylate cyclase [Aphanocapsa sp. GSE-SYN-MK-11-07L]